MKSKSIISFLMVFILSFSVLLCPLNVEAGGGGSSRPEGEKVDRSKVAEFLQKSFNWFSLALSEFGVFINPQKWGDDQLRTNYYNFLAENKLIDSDEYNFVDVITDHLYFSGDSDGEGGYLFNDHLTVTLDEEISDSIHAFAQAFVEENSIKYRIFDTANYKQINPSAYRSKESYDRAQSFLNDHNNDIIMSFTPESSGFGIIDTNNILCFYIEPIVVGYTRYFALCAMDEDWTSVRVYDGYKYNSSNNNYELSYADRTLQYGAIFKDSYNYTRWSSPLNFSYKGGKAITVFDSREHAVDWITGHRDIYTTDKFNNYQSGNNIRITGDSLNNSNNTYNIINNAVNNYYENGGGYTDADIAAIIAAVLAGLEGSGSGSGSGSGDTNITVSGGDASGGLSGGLTGFLDGIGSILDAILAIAGKLLEYVGKAIDLFSDVILKVIDIIPRGFTEFISELFPFLPKEIFVGIELIIALSVVLMIVGFFKK